MRRDILRPAEDAFHDQLFLRADHPPGNTRATVYPEVD